MTETVSDERLRELAQGYETWSKTNSSRPQIDKDTASALRELLALRTPPQNTDGEAVAWQADWPDDPAFPEWTLNRTTAEKWHERGAMITPLVPASTLSAMKAERDALAKALEEEDPHWLEYDEQMADELHEELRKQGAFSIERRGKITLNTYAFGKIVWDAFRRSTLQGDAK